MPEKSMAARLIATSLRYLIILGVFVLVGLGLRRAPRKRRRALYIVMGIIAAIGVVHVVLVWQGVWH
jgi:hypothetical protein